MPIDKRPVGEIMTPSPHTIGRGQSVAVAKQRMEELGIRHLPVLDGGQLVGMVSERDLALVVASSGSPAEEITVEDAMTPEPYAVVPETPLHDVVQQMAARKYGAAIVTEGRNVTGVFTTTDALFLLRDLLAARVGFEPRRLMPSEVRTRILDEHTELRVVLADCLKLAGEVLAGQSGKKGLLRERCRDLYGMLLRHMELEDAILGPALRETDAYGPLREKQLREEHRNQRATLARALIDLDTDQDATELAGFVKTLVDDITRDMAHEEKDLLTEDLLKDDIINAKIFGG